MMNETMVIPEHTNALFKKIFQCLKPTEDISVAQWADKYRRLPQESSAEPGHWKTSRTPYLQKPMECISDENVREVVLMTAAQLGKSEVILNAMGYYAHIDPSAMLLVQPTVSVGEKFSKERIGPTIRDTPILRSIIGTDKSRFAANTINQKFFPGGYIAIVGANSPAGLASRPIKVLLCDEIDRWPESARKEGDPLAIVEKRTTTFPYSKKIIKVSTPTVDSISRIQHEFERGTMERWTLPCPECNEYHELRWANIIFLRNKITGERDKTKEVLHECPSCGILSNEFAWKNGEGKWFAENEQAEVKSFTLSSLVSPWKSWAEIVDSFLSSKDDVEMLKVWVNTELGEPWIEQGESVDFEVLYNRREYYAYDVPKDVLVLTAGVDVQDDRFELEVVGWGENKVSWGIEYKVIHGNTALPETWDRLDQHLLKTYKHADKTIMPIMRTAIDSGGHRTQETYDFCKVREQRGVYAIKGRGGTGMNIVHTHSYTKKVKNLLFTIAVDTAKSILYSRLALEEQNAGYCHFPKNNARGYDEKYFEGLTSEVKITKMVKGRPKTEWRLKTGRRNEPLDVRVYAIAALEILNPNFEELKKRKGTPQPPKKRRGTISKGIKVD